MIKEKLKNYARKLILHHRFKNAAETGIVPYPDTVVFEPTMRCNLHCKMCYINFPSMIKCTKNELTINQIKEVINKFPKTIKKMNFTGGEPFLREGMVEILEYINSKNIKIAISTNLTLLNENVIKELKEKGILKNIFFSTSIDGSREIHDKIRGKGKFDLLKNNTKLLQEYGSNVHQVTSVIQEDNLDNLKDIVNILKELGIKNLQLEYEYMVNKESLEIASKTLNTNLESFPINVKKSLKPNYSLEKLKKVILDVEKAAKEANINLGYFPNNFAEYIKDYYNSTYRTSKKNYCKHMKMIRINPQGDVVWCFMIRTKLGNLIEQSFDDIWYSEKMKEFRRNLTKNNLTPLCDSCLYMC